MISSVDPAVSGDTSQHGQRRGQAVCVQVSAASRVQHPTRKSDVIECHARCIKHDSIFTESTPIAHNALQHSVLATSYIMHVSVRVMM